MLYEARQQDGPEQDMADSESQLESEHSVVFCAE